jgi:serine protease AprX
MSKMNLGKWWGIATLASLSLTACQNANTQPKVGQTNILSSAALTTATIQEMGDALAETPDDTKPFANIEASASNAGRIVIRPGKLPEQSDVIEVVTVRKEKLPQKPIQALPTVDSKPVDKIPPSTYDYIKNSPDALVKLTLVFKDTIPLPEFPHAQKGRSDQELKSKTDALVSEIEQRRSISYDKITKVLEKRFNAKIIQKFWISKTIEIEIDKKYINVLSQIPDLVGIFGGAISNAFPTVQAGRILSDTDILNSVVPSSSGGGLDRIALIDTGVRSTHQLLQGRIANAYDCTQPNCVGGDPSDVIGTLGHGTSSAAIIAGSGVIGASFLGVTTKHLIDSYKTGVYSQNSCTYGNLPYICSSYPASINAIQKVKSSTAQTVILDLQFCPNYADGINIAREANKLYDSGKVVLAANGNYGDSGSIGSSTYCNFANGNSSVASPATAHKVLGVGITSANGSYIGYQSRGPTLNYGGINSGNRTKPDFTAPTNMETANNTNDTSRWDFGGTSAAAPFAAGVAGLWRKVVSASSYVYPLILATGLNNQYPVNNNTIGNGLINTRGSQYNIIYQYGPYSDVSVNGIPFSSGMNSTGQVNEYIFGTSKITRFFKIVVWWPENYDVAHNDIDLEVVTPTGTIFSSTSIYSIWEAVGDTASYPAGVWKIRIKGYSIPSANQQFYYAFYRGEDL